eukprot:6992429-Lingulodinium_polyedra.AAC.1
MSRRGCGWRRTTPPPARASWAPRSPRVARVGSAWARRRQQAAATVRAKSAMEEASARQGSGQ